MPRKFERTALLLLLVASPFWLPAIPSSVSRSMRSAVMEWMKPAFQGIHSVRSGAGALFSGVLEIPAMREENRILRDRLELLLAHEETHRQLAQENARLRKMLHFKARASWRTTTAEVIGREIGPWSRGLLLDQGARDGIEEGMAVITPLGLVGRIQEVGPGTSRVALLTDPHFRVMATLARSRSSGLVMGSGAGECTLTYLPLDLKLEPGEPVHTAGGKSFCPPGVPIGVVDKVWRDSSQMFQTARLKPAVHPGTVEEALVLSWRSDGSGR